MNQKSAALFMACHGPGQSDARIRKALEFAQNDPQLAPVLFRQISFDQGIFTILSSAQMPEELPEKLQPEPGHKRLSHLKNPVFLSGIFGALLIVGTLLFFGLQKLKTFPGMNAVTEMLENTGSMSGAELEPLQTQAGKLGDWFFLKYQAERYEVPKEFADWKTVGCRMFKQDGHPVAQIAVEKESLLFFIFKAHDFGIQLPATAKPWHLIEQEGWTAAIRHDGDTCFMMAFVGSKERMAQLLKKLPAP